MLDVYLIESQTHLSFSMFACCSPGIDEASRMGPPMGPWTGNPSQSAVPYYGYASSTPTTAPGNPYTSDIAVHMFIPHVGGDLFDCKLEKGKQGELMSLLEEPRC